MDELHGMDAPLALETHGLTKVYGSGHTEVVALRDATMRVRRSEVAALLGPSGAGKSTFLLCVGLINPPTNGRVAIGGRPVLDGPRPLADLRRFRRENIGFVFQKSNLIPFLNAVENVQIDPVVGGRMFERVFHLFLLSGVHFHPVAHFLHDILRA